jgi:hypothetical protein
VLTLAIFILNCPPFRIWQPYQSDLIPKVTRIGQRGLLLVAWLRQSLVGKVASCEPCSACGGAGIRVTHPEAVVGHADEVIAECSQCNGWGWQRPAIPPVPDVKVGDDPFRGGHYREGP